MNSEAKRLKTLILATVFVATHMGSRDISNIQGNQIDVVSSLSI